MASLLLLMRSRKTTFHELLYALRSVEVTQLTLLRKGTSSVYLGSWQGVILLALLRKETSSVYFGSW